MNRIYYQTNNVRWFHADYPLYLFTYPSGKLVTQMLGFLPKTVNDSFEILSANNKYLLDSDDRSVFI